MVFQFAALRRFPLMLLKTPERRGLYMCRPLSSSSKPERKVTSSYWNQTCSEPLSPFTLGTYVDTAAERFGDRVGWSFLQEEKHCSFSDFKNQDAGTTLTWAPVSTRKQAPVILLETKRRHVLRTGPLAPVNGQSSHLPSRSPDSFTCHQRRRVGGGTSKRSRKSRLVPSDSDLPEMKATFAASKAWTGSAEVDRVAQGLLSLGFNKGDTMLIWSPNTFNWTLMAAAMAKVGIISDQNVVIAESPLRLFFIFGPHIQKVGFKGVFIAEPFKVFNYYDMLSTLIPELRHSKPGQLNSTKGCIPLRELTQSVGAELREAQDKVSMDDPLTILFTSGTTGTPKAAVISHHNYVNNVVAFHYRAPLSEDMVVCVPLPFFHVYGLSVVLGRTLIAGVKAVVPTPSYDLTAMLKAIQEHRFASNHAFIIDLQGV
ncbi:hypothetical protein HPB50_022153 [Hyalomma asiaticum]|uniref:Uncharacterized protein n=1 Tax=Hyalomma asiaticum TaxID=266040 RepID=A0ACB7RWC2_HYAAI|nr:hypothetical protein HPB50_022153 [Hyalomma asiaticum]